MDENELFGTGKWLYTPWVSAASGHSVADAPPRQKHSQEVQSFSRVSNRPEER